MADQYPAIIILAPFFTAFAVCLVGLWKKGLCFPLVVLSLVVSASAAAATLLQVICQGEIVYLLGGWQRPFGIEFRIDTINALVLMVVSVSALITSFYSKRAVATETPDVLPYYYTLYLLLVTGLLGMTLTGDAFNLYVLIEVVSLTSYALIAMGSKRAVLSAFNYIILGTIGASFYLLGVGYLYIKTGSLNMVDIQQVLAANDLYGSESVFIAFILIMVGVWIKMAFFPLHGWLPNAYAFAPSTTGCLLAPLVTKVTIYVMIRMMLTVFGVDYVFAHWYWSEIIVWMAVIAIVFGSILALAQTDLKKMLAYIIVAEVGYMVGGVWLANETALTGAIYHIVSDAFMTLCLFIAAGVIIRKTGSYKIRDLDGLFKKMPWTMAGFTVGALSMIGIPPTCGFFSKWYLISGGIEADRWEYVIALLFSSLVNAVLFFRVIEVAYYEPLPEGDAHGHHDHGHVKIEEAPLSMLLPLLVAAVSLVLIGVFNQDIVEVIQQTIVQFNLSGGVGS